MINYLKQYTDKTFEELVNSLMWFDLPLKLKAIFAKLPSSGGNQDLQKVLDVNPSFSFGGVHSGTIGGGDGDVPFTQFTYDILDGSVAYLEISGNNVFMQSVVDSGLSEATLQVVEGKVNIQQNSAVGETIIGITEPIESTALNFPAKTVAGDYTIDVTSDTLYTVGTLPSGVLNDKAIVSDATAPTYLGVLVGGGSVVTPVWHNGTIWVSR